MTDIFVNVLQKHFPARTTPAVLIHLHFPDKEATKDGLEHNPDQ